MSFIKGHLKIMLSFSNQRGILALFFLLFVCIVPAKAQTLDTSCNDMALIYLDQSLVAKPINDLSQKGRYFIKSIDELRPYNFAWANSVSKLAFMSGVNDAVYVSDKENVIPQLIIEADPNIRLTNLTWSPDGRFLAYYKYIADLTNNAEKDSSFVEVYDLDSKQAIQLLEPFHDQAFISSLDSLAWSPDGEVIAVTMGVLPYESKLYLINTACLHNNQTNCDTRKLDAKNINNWELLTEGQIQASWSNDGHLWFICGGEYCVYDSETETVERYKKPDLQGFMLLSCSNNFIFWTNDRTLNLYNVNDKVITKRTEWPIPVLVIPFPTAQFLFTE
jgi:WD40 repeat protein